MARQVVLRYWFCGRETIAHTSATALLSILSVGIIGFLTWSPERPVLAGHGAGLPSSQASLRPCKVSDLEAEIRCGTYDVYENRAARSGRKIPLNIVVVPALNTDPAPDPVFWIDGGPGLGSTGSARLAVSWFSEIRKSHDLVFVDQRGTGKSNPLRCEFDSSPDDLQNFFSVKPLPERVRQCREAAQELGDLRFYTTPIAMDDLDEVRDALGYDKINIAGMSYGSLAAQVFLRQHGDHVRAAALIAIITPDFRLPLGIPRSAQHAFDLILDDCAADEACHKAFPRLREELDVLLMRFKRGPVSVELLRLSDKGKQSVLLSRQSLVRTLTYSLTNTRNASMFPIIVHQAFENDFIPLEIAAVRLNSGAQVARGMYFTVTCSETARYIADVEINRETKDTPAGDQPIRDQMAACQEWPLGDVPPAYVKPVSSDAPVLIIAGDADPLSGPWFGENAIKTLPNGRLVKVRNFGHQFGDLCTKDIFSSFIEKGSSANLDISCIDAIRRPPFHTQIPSWFSMQ